MSGNLKCQNHGGYSTQMRNVVCGLDPEKVCAGFDSGCNTFIGIHPERKRRDENANY